MNNGKGQNENDSYKSLLLLEELSKGNVVTQRDLSKSLGIALGLINSYLKNLVSKGYITVTAIPKKRYKYYLTPKGFTEKTRLTYHHLQNFTNLYKTARRDFQELFHVLEKDGVKDLIFCGVDEVAEIAYLSLKEVNIRLIAIMDDEKAGEKFFEYDVLSLNRIDEQLREPIVITKFHDEGMYQRLINIGIGSEKIYRRGSKLEFKV
ncbi:MAG: winged helix-turn-helix transcriptional regulator [Nitrospirota bacterium]|mgnify:FL=1